MEIYELDKSNEYAWDKYVHNHPDSTLYHLIGWKNVVERSYGHKPYYLLAKECEEIKGVLPLFLMKSILFGRKLISLPFAPYGGVIGEDNLIEEFLIRYAIDISEDLGADYIELRNNTRKDSKLPCNTIYKTMILKLDNDFEVIWKSFNNKVRNAVRKSLNSGLEISKGSVDEFYKLYSKNMKYLGTPTHSREFFNNVIIEYKQDTDILAVHQNGKPISMAIMLYFKDSVISGWAASDREYRNLNPNNLLYCSAIKNACNKGYKSFDFGRSIAGSGTFSFKKPWGADEKQLHYMYYLNSMKQLPNTSQANFERQYFAKIWKIMPLSFTNTFGPMLRGNFP